MGMAHRHNANVLMHAMAFAMVSAAAVNSSSAIGKWSPGPTLQQARFYLATTAIGSKIYAVQGQSMATYLQSTEVLDITQKNAREGHGVAAVGTKIYCIGGTKAASGAAVTEVMILDQAGAGGWSVGPPLTQARLFFAVAAVNAKIYAVGGAIDMKHFPGGTTEYLDTATAGGAWTAGPSLSQPRGFHCLVAVGTKLYAIGGVSGHTDAALNSVEVLDTAAGRGWKPGPTLTSPRWAFAAAALGTKIYLVGGLALHTRTQWDGMSVLDTAAATGWVSGPTPRNDFAVAAVAIGARLYAIGGSDRAATGKQEALANIYVFDPSAPPKQYPICETAWPTFQSAN